MEVTINLKFEKDYNVELVSEIGSEDRYYFPNNINNGGKDGLIVRVTPFGLKPWIGIFAFGDIAPRGVSAIYTMPSSDRFCVISKGAGYIVTSTNPEKWEKIKAIPITDVRSIESQKIIVFADYTELVAYDAAGLKWRTERLAYDSFKIIDVDNNILRGTYWSIRDEEEQIFEVNLIDGSQVGGSGEI